MTIQERRKGVGDEKVLWGVWEKNGLFSKPERGTKKLRMTVALFVIGWRKDKGGSLFTR